MNPSATGLLWVRPWHSPAKCLGASGLTVGGHPNHPGLATPGSGSPLLSYPYPRPCPARSASQCPDTSTRALLDSRGTFHGAAKEPPAPPVANGRCPETVWRRPKFERRHHENTFRRLRIARVAICNHGKRISVTDRLLRTSARDELYRNYTLRALVSLPNRTLARQPNSDITMVQF